MVYEKNIVENKISEKEKGFFDSYWNNYKKLLFDSRDDKKLLQIKNLFLKISKNGGKVIFVGNGASASLASHAATDLTKQAHIKAIALNDHNLITALSNDYGYERWVEKALSYYASEKDLLVLISVSGESLNLVKAVEFAKNNLITSLSLTGSSKSNKLRNLTDYSLWVNCKSYNIVESIHTIWITLIIDLIVGKSEYSVNLS